jgi:hypothetical protein
MTDTVIFGGFAVAYAVLLGWGGVQASRHGWLTPASLPLLVVAGLLYDNTVIASGRFVGEGALLEQLNVARYWVHAFLTPLLVVFAWDAVARAGAGWARTRAAAAGAVVVAVGLVVLELVLVVADLAVEPTWEYGVLTYADTGGGDGPPLMVLGVAAALLVAGFLVWRRQGWGWLLVGSVVMTVGSAVPVPVDSAAVVNGFELVLLVSLLLTRRHQDREAHQDLGPLSAGGERSMGEA